MTRNWKGVERMLLLSTSFTVVLILLRVVYWRQFAFLFFIWNLFLATIPLLISSRIIKHEKLRLKSILALCLWLVFLPNAPYIVTDIFHFTARPPVPTWFDLLMISSAAWNGLMLGIISLLQVEEFLRKHFRAFSVNLLMLASILSCAYGIYVGRFMRFNSWDVITNPTDVAHTLGRQFLEPQENMKTWAFTLLFGTMLSLIYYTFKKLPSTGLDNFSKVAKT